MTNKKENFIMDIKLYILILILPLYVCAVIKYSIYKRKKIKQIINITKITKVDLKKCKKANFIYTNNRKVISFFSYVIYFILFESILNVVITQSKSHVFF